jgi:hypothetical protein
MTETTPPTPLGSYRFPKQTPNSSILHRLPSVLKALFFWRDTTFDHFKYLYTTDPDPVPNRTLIRDDNYFKVIDHAMRKHLLGYDYMYITTSFHRATSTNEDVNLGLKRADLPPFEHTADEHYFRARQRAKDLLTPPDPFRPVHLKDMLQYDWNFKPSAELPYCRDPELLKRLQQAHDSGTLPNAKANFGNLKNVIFDDLSSFLHRIKRDQVRLDPSNRSLPPDRIHVKPRISTLDKNKLRIIFGRSKRFIIPEAMFFWPYFRWLLYDRFSDPHNPLLWGCETLLGGWSRLNTHYCLRHMYYNTFVTADLSDFDQRALFPVIDDLTSDWRSFFTFSNGYIPTTEYPTSSADPVHLNRLFDFVIWSIKNVPFLHPSGKVFQRLHRYIPSGLFTTQFLDSHYNLVLILTCLDAMGIDINTVHIRVQGDDSILALRIYIPANQHSAFMERLAYEMKTRFDAILSSKKSLITNTPQEQTVLGYSNNNGYPYRDWRPLLANLLHPGSATPQFEDLMSLCSGLIWSSIYERNTVNVCSDIFNYLKQRGYTPSGHTFGLLSISEEAGLNVDTTKLPTLNDVTRHLRLPPSERLPIGKKEYWPHQYFLSTK